MCIVVCWSVTEVCGFIKSKRARHTRLSQALSKNLGPDVLHAPHFPQKAVPLNNHVSWLSLWRNIFPRLPPPRPNGSSSSLLLSATTRGTWQLSASTHRSCQPTIASPPTREDSTTTSNRETKLQHHPQEGKNVTTRNRRRAVFPSSSSGRRCSFHGVVRCPPPVLGGGPFHFVGGGSSSLYIAKQILENTE